MMTKKCYAHIKTSQEVSEEIKALTDEVLAPGGMTKAYNAIKQIAELNNRFHRQFKDTSPEWMPPENQSRTYTKYQQQARQQYAQSQMQQPAQQPVEIPPTPVYAYAMAYDENFMN